MTPPIDKVWDAVSMLNLVATNRAQEILATLGGQSYIVKEVREGEVIYLRPLLEEDAPGKLISVDLAPLLTSGLMQEVELTQPERVTFISFAARVDDGEARSVALASHRGLCLVTDDKLGIRLAQGLTPPVPVLTTLEWIKQWADVAAVSKAVLEDVIRRIDICAHFRPQRNHSLKSWWQSHLTGQTLV